MFRTEILKMSGSINILAVLLTDFLGGLLAIIMLASRAWKFTDRKKENTYLITMIVAILLSCIADSIAFYFDGKSGAFTRFLVFFGNMCLFMLNILISYCWLKLLISHLNLSISKAHERIIVISLASAAAVLIINIFVPIVFSVNENNVYTRGPLFWFYLVINVAIILDSLFAYFRARKISGGLKFFPVWAYIFPGVIGVLLQSIFYGISVLGPCTAISIAGLLISLQGELVFKDKLSGLYNRYYLDYIKEVIAKSKQSVYSIMMLDLNGFKKINDNYGHDEGDNAIVKASEILTSAIQSRGTVIRYAGDEFIIILNTQDEELIQKETDNIKNLFNEYNKTNSVPYELSASIGYCKVDLKLMSIDEMMNLVDRRMYEDKKRYYSFHHLL